MPLMPMRMPLTDDAVRLDRRIERDERRLVEQIAVAVVLADREHHVALRHAGHRRHVEQQVVALARHRP